MIVYTKSGQPVTLEESGDSGSEGSVHVVSDQPWMVAKIYHPNSPNADERRVKVEAMAECYPSLCSKAPTAMKKLAWPTEALFRDEEATDFAGFLMRRAKGEPLPIACQPSGGAKGMRRVLMALEQLCLVTQFLHFMGIVVGDWNPLNFLVDDLGFIELIDVDGFHLVFDEDTVYPCDVCAEGYAAPELFRAQSRCGLDYGEMARQGLTTFTQQTDNFALAVTVFRAMNQWTHPFEGSVELAAGQDYVPPRPLDEYIAEGASPFIGTSNMRLKPWALPLSYFHPWFREAFQYSLFDDDPSQRLKPEEWQRLIEAYRESAVECACGKHVYFSGFSACPYCQVEAQANKARELALGPEPGPGLESRPAPEPGLGPESKPEPAPEFPSLDELMSYIS